MKQLLSTALSVWYVLLERKTTLLSVLVLPAMLTFLSGVAYDHNSMLSLTIGTYAEALTPLGQTVLHTLEEQGYTLVTYKNPELCLERVKEGRLHSCVILSKLENREQATFYVNPSDLSIAEYLRSVVYGTTTGPANAAAQNTTRQLLGEVQSAREAAANIRPTIVDLTTNYQAISEEVDSFVIGLRTTTAPINLSLIASNDTLGNSHEALLTWIDSLGRVKTDMMDSYETTEQDVKALLDESAISELEKTEIIARLTQGRNAMNDISEQFRSNELLTRSRSDKLTTAIQDLARQLSALQEDIKTFNTMKSEARYQAEKVKSHVDKTLLGVASVQRSLNIIGAAVLEVTSDDPNQVLAPLDARVNTVRDGSTPFDYVFPNVLLLFVLVIGISIGGMTHVHFATSPAAIRRRATPVHPRIHLLGQHLGAFLLVFTVGAIMSATALLFLPLSLTVLPLLLSAVAGTGLVSVLLGSFIGHFARSEEQAVLWGMGASFTAIIVSPLLRPIEQLPGILQTLATVNPLTCGLNVARSAVGAGTLNIDNLVLLAIASFGLLLVLMVHARWNTSN